MGVIGSLGGSASGDMLSAHPAQTRCGSVWLSFCPGRWTNKSGGISLLVLTQESQNTRPQHRQCDLRFMIPNLEPQAQTATSSSLCHGRLCAISLVRPPRAGYPDVPQACPKPSGSPDPDAAEPGPPAQAGPDAPSLREGAEAGAAGSESTTSWQRAPTAEPASRRAAAAQHQGAARGARVCGVPAV